MPWHTGLAWHAGGTPAGCVPDMFVAATVLNGGRLSQPSGIVRDGDLCYVLCARSLTILDVSTPSAPFITGYLALGNAGPLGDPLFKSGDYVYCRRNGFLYTVDVSDPTNPALVDTLTLTGSSRGSPAFVLSAGGGVLYVAGFSDFLHVLDVSTPSAPTVITNFAHTPGTQTLKALTQVGSYVFGSANSRFNAFDVSTPATPAVSLGAVDANVQGATGLVRDGNTVYLTARGTGVNRIQVYDISTPTLPVAIGGINDATNLNFPTAVVKSGSNLWVSARTNSTPPGRVTVVNVSTPSSPSVTTSLTDNRLTDAFDLVADGTNLFVTCRAIHTLAVVEQDTSPVVVGSVSEPLTTGINSIAKLGANLMVILAGNVLSVVDVSVDPLVPVGLGLTQHGTGTANAVEVATNGSTHAYVARNVTTAHLTVVDCTDPRHPQTVGTADQGSSLSGVAGIAYDGGYCFIVANIADRLTAFDVSTPASPSVVGTLQDSTNLGGATSVVTEAGVCYVVGGNRFTTVDVSTPSAPTVIASITGTSTQINGATHVIKQADTCYVVGSGGSGTVAVVDVTNPAAPAITDSYGFIGAATGVAVQGGYVFGTISNEVRSRALGALSTLVETLTDATVLTGARRPLFVGQYLYVPADIDNDLVIIDTQCNPFAAGSTGWSL